MIRCSESLRWRVTPEPAIGPLFARTRWAPTRLTGWRSAEGAPEAAGYLKHTLLSFGSAAFPGISSSGANGLPRDAVPSCSE
jgi:hypothetical protein